MSRGGFSHENRAKRPQSASWSAAKVLRECMKRGFCLQDRRSMVSFAFGGAAIEF